MRIFAFTFLFLCSTLLAAKENGCLEALLVFDTTTDLRGCLVKNKKLMINCLSSLSQAAGMKLQVKVLESTEVTQSNIQEWLVCLNKGKRDVVFFYFSGHGRESSDSEWPMLYLHPNQQTVSMDSIARDLEKSSSRLTLVFSDCCNSSSLFPLSDIVVLLPAWSYKALPYLQKSLSLLKKVDRRGLKKRLRGSASLWLKRSGFIKVAAATKTQRAIALQDVGTVFTIALTSSLVNLSEEKNPSWEQVMGSVEDMCRPLQIPHKSLSIR